jgi:peptidoglycan hydrolase CwlO-like protein
METIETTIKTGVVGAVIGATLIGGSMYLTTDELAQAEITKIDSKTAEITTSVTETVNIDEKVKERESLVARKQILQIQIDNVQKKIAQVDADIEAIDSLIAELKAKGLK